MKNELRLKQHEMPQTSIIIPVYNVEPYIGACLDSLVAQTCKDFEVLFVDDCGTDGSVRMINDFIVAHPEIPCRLLHHEHNRGLSAARNTGLEAAQGEYVLFLDSDDALTPDALELLTKPIENGRPDFVIGGYSLSDGSDPGSPLSLPVGQETDVLGTYARGQWYVMAWNKLCNRQFLIDNALWFREGLNHEDVLWSFKLACKAKTMYTVPAPTYLYNVRESSIMTSMSVRKDLYLYLDIFDEIRQFIVSEGLQHSRDAYEIFEGKRCGIIYSLLHKGETALYKESYGRFRDQSYVSPFEAGRSGMIGTKQLVRDLHYALPKGLGRLYKQAFYNIYYKLLGHPVEGLIWK